MTNDYIVTYFDNNVVLKLYSELEFFVKSIFYEKIDVILKRIPYDSKQYGMIFNMANQREDFNLHYHQEDEKLDTNFLFGKKKFTVKNLLERNILVKEKEDRMKEVEVKGKVKSMSFAKLALGNAGRMEIEQQVVEKKIEKNSVRQF